MPADRRRGERIIDGIGESGIIGVSDTGQRRLWMQVERDAQRGCGFVDRVELRQVHVTISRATEDQRAFEVQRLDGTMQFIRGGLRIRRR